MLREIFDGGRRARAGARRAPLLMGPAPGMIWPQLATWFPAFLEGTRGALDAAVYHSCVAPPVTPTLPPRACALSPGEEAGV